MEEAHKGANMQKTKVQDTSQLLTTIQQRCYHVHDEQTQLNLPPRPDSVFENDIDLSMQNPSSQFLCSKEKRDTEPGPSSRIKNCILSQMEKGEVIDMQKKTPQEPVHANDLKALAESQNQYLISLQKLPRTVYHAQTQINLPPRPDSVFDGDIDLKNQSSQFLPSKENRVMKFLRGLKWKPNDTGFGAEIEEVPVPSYLGHTIDVNDMGQNQLFGTDPQIESNSGNKSSRPTPSEEIEDRKKVEELESDDSEDEGSMSSSVDYYSCEDMSDVDEPELEPTQVETEAIKSSCVLEKSSTILPLKIKDLHSDSCETKDPIKIMPLKAPFLLSCRPQASARIPEPGAQVQLSFAGPETPASSSFRDPLMNMGLSPTRKSSAPKIATKKLLVATEAPVVSDDGENCPPLRCSDAQHCYPYVRDPDQPMSVPDLPLQTLFSEVEFESSSAGPRKMSKFPKDHCGHVGKCMLADNCVEQTQNGVRVADTLDDDGNKIPRLRTKKTTKRSTTEDQIETEPRAKKPRTRCTNMKP